MRIWYSVSTMLASRRMIMILGLAQAEVANARSNCVKGVGCDQRRATPSSSELFSSVYEGICK